MCVLSRSILNVLVPKIIYSINFNAFLARRHRYVSNSFEPMQGFVILLCLFIAAALAVQAEDPVESPSAPSQSQVPQYI
jgi:hypothetical protein